MKHEKLQQISSKSTRYMRLCWLFFSLLIFLLGCIVFLISFEIDDFNFIGPLLLCCIALAIMAVIFGRLEAKQYHIAQTYFILKVMDLINEFGISSDDFEIIQETTGIYWIGFHNQTVDYDKLQNAVDNELIAMNKIMKSNIRVNLI